MGGELYIEGQALKFKEFNLSDMVKNATIVMIAKRGSGKSWCVKHILKYLDDTGIPGGTIISPTDDVHPFYSKFVPDLYIHYEFEPEILRKIFYRQDRIIEKRKQRAKLRKRVDARVFLVMDDCLGDGKKWKNDPDIRKIFMNGRHHQITFILTMQYPLGIGPELRTNIDYVFLLTDDIISNQKRLFDNYAGMFPDYNTFRAVYLNLTEDFGAMVINNRCSSRDIYDKVFYFKAKRQNDDRIGCRQFKDIHDINYDSHYKDKPTNYDISKFAKQHKKEDIKVIKEK